MKTQNTIKTIGKNTQNLFFDQIIMTTLRKIFSKKKAKKLKDNILDFDLRKLLVFKSLLILIFISVITVTFIYVSFLFPLAFVFEFKIHPKLGVILIIASWIVLFFPCRYLLRKLKSNFIAVKEEYKAKGYFKILSDFFKRIF